MTKKLLQPIDRVAIALVLFLSLVMGLLVGGTKACGKDCFLFTGARVRDFNWEGEKIGAENTAFILSFDRPMDQASVENNLVIEPPLAGKISWAGRRLAYTLETPAPYGTEYKVTLRGAREQFLGQDKPGNLMRPFVGQFSTRDRVFAYIGGEGEEKDRLILYNWTKHKSTILTPPDLIVIDFQPYPQGDHEVARVGDRILFSAIERQEGNQSLQENKLYTVETGLSHNSTKSISNFSQTHKIEQILDNQVYQNLKFQISQNGKIIVVQRVHRQNPGEFGLWIIEENKEPQPLNNSPGGDFLLAPDSQTLAIAQGEGIAILPLEQEAKPLDFLPKFGRVVSFSRDGRGAAMVNFNTDNPDLRYTRSLYFVNNQNVQQKLLDTNGSIIDCEFNPTATHLYCLLTQLLEGEEYQELPYLAEIELKTAKVLPLFTLPNYQDIQISMASDGLGLLFDQVTTTEASNIEDVPRTNSGEVITSGSIWLLIPPSVTSTNSGKPQLEQLPLAGFRPQWLP